MTVRRARHKLRSRMEGPWPPTLKRRLFDTLVLSIIGLIVVLLSNGAVLIVYALGLRVRFIRL